MDLSKELIFCRRYDIVRRKDWGDSLLATFRGLPDGTWQADFWEASPQALDVDVTELVRLLREE